MRSMASSMASTVKKAFAAPSRASEKPPPVDGASPIERLKGRPHHLFQRPRLRVAGLYQDGVQGERLLEVQDKARGQLRYLAEAFVTETLPQMLQELNVPEKTR